MVWRSLLKTELTLSASLQKTFKKISASANIRKPFITDIDAPLLPYLGVDMLLLENSIHRLNVNANVSRNFRAPTLNDRYWKDAGRMDLKPETSHAAEVGVDWKLHQKYNIAAGFFGQEVEDWIQWVPGADGMYRPQNVKEVGMSGIETSAETNTKRGPFLFRARATYQYTRSVTKQTHDTDQASIGKQLIYTPLHTGAATSWWSIIKHGR